MCGPDLKRGWGVPQSQKNSPDQLRCRGSNNSSQTFANAHRAPRPQTQRTARSKEPTKGQGIAWRKGRKSAMPKPLSSSCDMKMAAHAPRNLGHAVEHEPGASGRHWAAGRLLMQTGGHRWIQTRTPRLTVRSARKAHQ